MKSELQSRWVWGCRAAVHTAQLPPLIPPGSLPPSLPTPTSPSAPSAGPPHHNPKQDSGGGAAEYLERSKRQLARMALSALRHLHARGRLMEGVLWQLNSYILNCLERAGEAAADRDQQEEIGCVCRVWGGGRSCWVGRSTVAVPLHISLPNNNNA